MFMFDDLKVTSHDDRLTQNDISSCKCIITAWPTSILILCQGPCDLTHNTLWHSLFSKSGFCFLVLCNGWHTLNTAVLVVLLQVLHVMASTSILRGVAPLVGLEYLKLFHEPQVNYWGTVHRFLRSCVLWQEMEVAFPNLFHYLASVMVRLVAAPTLIDCYMSWWERVLLHNQSLTILPSLVCPEASSALLEDSSLAMSSERFLFWQHLVLASPLYV